MNKETNGQTEFSKELVYRYTKNISEMTVGLIKPQGAKSPTNPQLTLNSKEQLKTDGRSFIYEIIYRNWNECYKGETEINHAVRMREHKPTKMRHDYLSPKLVHENQKGHTFNLDTVCIVGGAIANCSKESAEAWQFSTYSINSHHEVDQICNSIMCNM